MKNIALPVISYESEISAKPETCVALKGHITAPLKGGAVMIGRPPYPFSRPFKGFVLCFLIPTYP